MISNQFYGGTYNLGVNNVVHCGNSTSFWHDSWISAIPLRINYKELFDICNFKKALISEVSCPTSEFP